MSILEKSSSRKSLSSISAISDEKSKVAAFSNVKAVHSNSEDGSEVVTNDKDYDQARALAGDERRIFTEEESELVKKKIDRLIIPLLCAVYFSQFLDKTSLNYSSVMGLPIVGREYNLVSLAFYAGFLFWEIPTSLIALYFPLAKYLGFNIVVWGIVLTCFAATPEFVPFFALRFLLGMFESCVSPILILIIASWYKKSEQASRIGSFYMMNGLTMCFGGLTSYGITFYSGSFAQWRILYIFLGLLGIAVGIMVLIFLPDSPSTAKFLTPRERLIALERVRDNQSGTVGRKFKMDQCVETLTDIKTWLLLLAVMIFSIPNGGLSNFSAIITRSFGYTAREALLLQVPSGVVAFITTILVTWWAQVKSTRMLPIIACVTPSLFGAALLVGLAGNTALYKGGLLFGIFIVNTYGSALSIIYAWSASNVAGSTKKATTNALILLAFAGGNMIGTLIFSAPTAPTYLPGKIAILALFVGIIPVVLTLRWLNIVANRNKAAALEAMIKENSWTEADTERERSKSAFMDYTDKKNPFFVYLP